MNTETIVTDTQIKYPIVESTEVDYCKLNVKYQADPAVVRDKTDEAVSNLRHAKIPGYRAGKAPDYAIKHALKRPIESFVINQMAEYAVDDIVFETNVKLLGRPSFKTVDLDGTKFKCEVELYTKPTFTVNDYKFEIPKPNVFNDDHSLMEKALFDLRMRGGETLPYSEDDVVEGGDNITISFTATIDGQPFEGSVCEGEMYSVGMAKWKGFDDFLLGMRAGDEKSFDFTFEDAPEALNGKTAKFTVSVHMGTKRKLADLTDEFAKQLGAESVEDLRQQLSVMAGNEIKRQFLTQLRQQVALRLIASNDFRVPDFLIAGESKFLAQRMGLDFDSLSDEENEKIAKQACDNIKLSLILDSIRDKEPDSVLNETEARNALENHFRSRGQSLSDVARVRPELVMIMASTIKDEFTLQWITDQSKVIE